MLRSWAIRTSSPLSWWCSSSGTVFRSCGLPWSRLKKFTKYLWVQLQGQKYATKYGTALKLMSRTLFEDSHSLTARPQDAGKEEKRCVCVIFGIRSKKLRQKTKNSKKPTSLPAICCVLANSLGPTVSAFGRLWESSGKQGQQHSAKQRRSSPKDTSKHNKKKRRRSRIKHSEFSCYFYCRWWWCCSPGFCPFYSFWCFFLLFGS